jgi:phage host-nuclease inhibitor protein Gam
MFDIESVLHQPATKRFEVKDIDTANWAITKMSKANQRIAAAQALAADYHKRVDDWLADITKEDRESIEFFESELRPFVAAELVGKKSKSVNLLGGKAGFRSPPPHVEVDEEQALKYCRAFAPELIRVKEYIDKAEVKKRIEKGEGIEGVRLASGEQRFYVEVE